MRFLGPAGVEREPAAVVGLSPQHPAAPEQPSPATVGRRQ